MIDYNSLPSVESVNLDKYWDIVRKLDPEFYLIRIAIQETETEAMIIPRIVRAISNLKMGTGFGKVTVYMQNHKITNVQTTESDQIINKFGEKDEGY